MHKTRNRLIAALLTFAMCLGVISPLSAFADDGTTTTHTDTSTSTAVASIGNTKFTSLASAVESAKFASEEENAEEATYTVTLLKCVDISSTGLNITGKVILDLNGHTITAANTDAGNIDVAGGDLTLKDSSATDAAEGTGKIVTNTDYSNTAGYCIILVTNAGNFTMDGGTIDTSRDNDPVNKGQFAVGFQGNCKNTITINGGTIRAGWYAISGHGTYQSDTSVVDIVGGKLISTSDYVIYAPSSATINIKGGTIESHILSTSGAAGAIAQRSGTINITGGEFVCTGTGNTGNYGDGTGGMDNAVISIGTGNAGLYGNCSLKIEDGSFTTSTNKIIDIVNSSSATYTATLTITGGTYNKIDATLAGMADDIYFTAGYADDDTAKATVLYTAAARTTSAGSENIETAENDIISVTTVAEETTAATPTLIVLNEDITLAHLDVAHTYGDVTLSKTNLTNSGTQKSEIAGSYNVTYDLNGNNLTYTGAENKSWVEKTSGYVYTETGAIVSNGDVLTIEDSTKAGTTERGGKFLYEGTLVSSSVVLCPESSGAVNASNVTFDFGKAGGFFPKNNATAVTITACDVTADTYGVGTNAAKLDNYGVKITIKDSKITSTGTLGVGAMINVAGTLDIENSEIDGGNQGVIVRAGTATIKNTKITTRGEYAGGTKDNVFYNGIQRWRATWSSGTCVPAAALTIGDKQGTGSTTYAADAIVTLENVTLTGENSFPALYVSGKTANKTTVTVTNSTIEGNIVEDANNTTNQITVTLDDATIEKITNLTEEVPSSYLSSGNYKQVLTKDSQGNTTAVTIVASNAATPYQLVVNGEATTETSVEVTMNPGDTLPVSISGLTSETPVWAVSEENNASKAYVELDASSNAITAKAATDDKEVEVTATVGKTKFTIKVKVEQLTSSLTSTQTVTKAAGNENEATVTAPTLAASDTNSPYATTIEAINSAISGQGITWKTRGLKGAQNGDTVIIYPEGSGEADTNGVTDNGIVITEGEKDEDILKALNAWIVKKIDAISDESVTTEAKAAVKARYSLPTDLPTVKVAISTADTGALKYSDTDYNGADKKADVAVKNNAIELEYGEKITLTYTAPDKGDYTGATATITLATADVSDETNESGTDGSTTTTTTATETPVVTVTDNSNNNTATIEAKKVDSTGVKLTVTISVAGKPELTTTQEIKVTVKKQTPKITVSGDSVEIKGTATKEKLTASGAFTFTVTDKYNSGTTLTDGTDGTLNISINEVEEDNPTSAAVTFTPIGTKADTYDVATLENGITWTANIVKLELALKASSTLTTKENGVYKNVELEFVLPTGVTNETFTGTDKTTMDGILSNFKNWKVSAKGYLYPVQEDGTAVTTTLADSTTAITTPQLFVKYLNEQLANQNGTAYPYVIDESLQDTNATATESEKDYVQNTAKLAETTISYDTDEAAKVLDLLFDKGAESTDLTAENVEKNLLAYLESALDIDLNETPSTSDPIQGGETTGEEGEEQTTTTTPAKPKVLAKAVYDVTYKDEDGNEQNYFGGEEREIVLPYPGDAQKDTYANYVVAHLVLHEQGEKASKNGTVEYLTPTQETDGLHVKVTSLSTLVAMATDQVVTLPSTASDTTEEEKKTDTASVAPAAKDDSGAIILAGAVVATVVVGGIIYYNWDKLPVHKIEGTVVDTNGAAIANATVTLAKDGKVVKTVTTDANGYYSAKVAKGDYTITVTVGEASATAEGSTGASAQLAIA
jgi:hypothetical protein